MRNEQKREIIKYLDKMWKTFQDVCPCSLPMEGDPIEEFLEAKDAIHQIIAGDKEHVCEVCGSEWKIEKRADIDL